MPDNKDLARIAETWRGTKWKHGVALKGYGADCVQFLIAVGIESGRLPEGFKSIKYSRDWALHNEHSILEDEIAKICTRVTGVIEIGDILIFKSGKTGGHAGIYVGDECIIHSQLRRGVIKQRMHDLNMTMTSHWRLPK